MGVEDVIRNLRGLLWLPPSIHARALTLRGFVGAALPGYFE